MIQIKRHFSLCRQLLIKFINNAKPGVKMTSQVIERPLHVQEFQRFGPAVDVGHLHQFGFRGGRVHGAEGDDSGHCQFQFREHRSFGAFA
ncbi:hypothetical protein [Limnohabitans sp. 63ED37-2]|uniref:hypothetical protein n=1 Tax=Limnohabitans sp. 63ED37-2 TaxID=1678128 RepID=UPI001E40EE4C|nr:hypothetical protein [Limnohabitans sp. 63ED37-2]